MTYSLMQNTDGSYDIIINISENDSEFALEFLSPYKSAKRRNKLAAFLKKHSGQVNIKNLKLVVAGAVIAAIPFAAVIRAGASGEKYSQAYLYGGSTAEQISYVKDTEDAINVVSPSWFDIDSDGKLVINEISTVLIDEMHSENINVVPFLSNHWNREGGIRFLQNSEYNAKALAEYVVKYELDGINIDIENVTHNEREQYTEFVRLLRERLPESKEVSVAVAANPNGWKTGWHGSYDYEKLGLYADHLFIMTYDEHYQGGDAGPVASIGFVEASVKYALKYVEPDKIVMGIPLFGRLWSNTGFNGQGIMMRSVESFINDYGGNITFDKTAMSPRLDFTVESGDPDRSVSGKKLMPGSYTLWFENSESIEAKLELVTKYGLKGAGSWALGQETKDIWKDYTAVLNNIDVQMQPDDGNEKGPADSTAASGASSTGGSSNSISGKQENEAIRNNSDAAAAEEASSNSKVESTASGVSSEPEKMPEATEEKSSSAVTAQQSEELFSAEAVEVVDLPQNLVNGGVVKDGGAAVLDRPGGRMIGWIAAGSVVLITAVTATGYLKIRWKRKSGFVKKNDVDKVK